MPYCFCHEHPTPLPVLTRWSSELHRTHVPLIRPGSISEKDVDAALGHLLSVRFRLGEFDSPELNPFAAIGIDQIGHPALALAAAEQGFVLLENRGHVLPLTAPALAARSDGGAGGGVVAVMGPNAVRAARRNSFRVLACAARTLDAVGGKGHPGSLYRCCGKHVSP